MTAIAGLRVPGKGCVIVTDSQVSTSDTRTASDMNKSIVHGHLTIAVAGQVQILRKIADLKPSIKAIADMESGALEWEAIVYDSRTDALWHIDMSGFLRECELFTAGGSGGCYMQGARAVLKVPKTLLAAEKQAHTLVSVAAQYDLFTGGPARVLVTRL